MSSWIASDFFANCIQLVAAIATAIIGWAAISISRAQTKAGLFDRRFKAYRDIAAGIASMRIDGAVYPSTYETLKEAVHLAVFLYDEKTVSLLDELLDQTYGAWMHRPLENRGRDADDYDKAEAHMRRMDQLWEQARPRMIKSLKTWKRAT